MVLKQQLRARLHVKVVALAVGFKPCFQIASSDLHDESHEFSYCLIVSLLHKISFTFLFDTIDTIIQREIKIWNQIGLELLQHG